MAIEIIRGFFSSSKVVILHGYLSLPEGTEIGANPITGPGCDRTVEINELIWGFSTSACYP